MTREEARKMSEVMMAFVEGKNIECKGKDEDGPWRTIISEDVECSFNWKEFDYRIKKEPIYRPFKNKEECWVEMQQHQPFGWVKTGGSFRNIIAIYDTRALISDNKCLMTFKHIFEDYQFADGTPFGIKEE